MTAAAKKIALPTDTPLQKLCKEFAREKSDNLAEVDFAGDAVNDIYEYIEYFCYEVGEAPSSISEMEDLLKTHINEFFQTIIEQNECGATITICKVDKVCPKMLTKQNVFDKMWTIEDISRHYSDFEFDIKEFGYQYFLFMGSYYLASGIPA